MASLDEELDSEPPGASSHLTAGTTAAIGSKKLPAAPPDSMPSTYSDEDATVPVGSGRRTLAPDFKFPAIGSSGSGGTKFLCLHFTQPDRLRAIASPPGIHDAIRTAIERSWQRGIQSERPCEDSSCEWKLSGRPWEGAGKDATPARRVMCHLLSALSSRGWHYVADLNRKTRIKSTLFFRSGSSWDRTFFCVSLRKTDRIRIIDPPDELTKQAFIAAVTDNWRPGIQRSKETGGYHQLQLRGNPWSTWKGAQIENTGLMLCSVMSAMAARGFGLVASVDLIGGMGEQGSDNSWFFASKAA